MLGRHAPANRLIVLAVLVATTLMYMALWFLYRNARRDLEGGVADRLEKVAYLVASTLQPDPVQDAWEVVQAAGGDADSIPALLLDPAVAGVQSPLRRMRRVVDAANITLFDWNGAPFLDLVSFSPEQLRFPHAFAAAEVQTALAVGLAHGPLYHTGRQYLLTAYARVPPLGSDTDPEEMAFVVAIEVDAPFFAVLERLRTWLTAVAALGAVVVLLLSLLFAGVQRRLVRAETQVQRAETLAAMGRMTAGIAHEIRNPLGIIRATASRLKKRYDSPTQPDERFDFITQEVDRLSGILSGYLAFARDEPLRAEPVDLAPVVGRAVRMMQPELGGIEVDLQLPPTCVARADAQRLQQLLMNLLINSAQAMPEGGRLRLELHDGRREILLRVDDSGPGFPANRSRLLEPFVTTREKGSGLGLVVVARIVEQHGGRLELGTADLGGARVDVHLPKA